MRTLGRVGGVALVLLALLAPEAIAAAPKAGAGYVRGKPDVRRAVAATDNSGRMDANDLDMFVTNHGSFGWDLTTSEPGLRYPNGTTKTALFAAGIWVGAQVNDTIRTCIAEYSQEYAPGPMYNGTFQVDQPAFKNYRLEADNTTSDDYLNWPSQPVPLGQGAPLDTLGNPLLQGSTTLWSVYNDADPGRHTNGSAGRTKPLGLEIQQSTFAFTRGGALGKIIFIKFRLINKGANSLDSTYISIWADPDLGDASDDLVGCDTTLSLGYCYNEGADDAVYGLACPAVGFDFFRGPIVQVSPGVYDTLGMTSFNKYINGEDPTSATEAYHLMQGLKKNGSPLHVNDNPLQPITTFQFPGDPVTSSGWLDSGGNDRRMQLSTGPFTMAVGDTQDVVCAVIIGQGTDRLSSITDLRQNDDEAQTVFDLNFDIPSPPPNATVYVHPLDRGIRLIWGTEPVGTNSANVKLGQDFHFEGFRVWQLQSNNSLFPPKVVATIDVDDSVGAIYTDLHNRLKGGALERTLVAAGTNTGLRYSIDLTTDEFHGGRLVNNKEYYFAVTSYSFDVNNTATFFQGLNPIGTISEVLESGFKIVTAAPRGSNAVLRIQANQISGDHVGNQVVVEQLVQSELADSVYHVTFAPDESWTVAGVVTGDTLVTGQGNQSGDFDYPIVRGFMPRVISTKPSMIFQHLASGDSLDLSNGGLDSAGVYFLDNEIGLGLEGFHVTDTVYHDYEIRILPDTTEFCWEYNGGGASPQATFRCPFEVWDLGANTYADASDDVKVTASIRDDDGSGSWTWGDRLYFRDFAYASVPWGTAGLLSTDVNPANDDRTLGRFGFEPADTSFTNNNPLPPPTRIKIRGGRLYPTDVFAFRILPVGTSPGTIVGNDIKKILAVPNPYYAHSAYELNQFDRVMKFTNIPAAKVVTVRIFNLAGDKVRTIRREATTADEMARAEIRWNLTTDNNLPVASGVYIYRVDVDGVGSKTDRLAVFVERERLDNY